MNRGRSIPGVICCIAAIMMLILDSRCAAASVAASVELCLRTLVPSLFPLFVLTAWLVPQMEGIRLPWLAKLLGIPQGSEGFFLIGAVGGFPMGACCIAQAVESDALSEQDGDRMLGFCNNCGPAFLFGVLGGILADAQLVTALFVIQLESAALIGILWPGRSHRTFRGHSDPASLPRAVRRGITSMANVCAWVILANVLADFLGRWLFPLLPEVIALLLTGLLELTTGCMALRDISGEMAFLLACVFVCFGGLCVHLQIHGFADWGSGQCFRQKAAQACIGLGLGVMYLQFGWVAMLVPAAAGIVKKTVEISNTLVYNNPSKGEG